MTEVKYGSTQMGKLKRSYSDRLGVAMNSLRFLYDGKRIPDDATPGMLEMERFCSSLLLLHDS